MRAALELFVLPSLERRGFTGALPHLRRVTPDGTHLFTYWPSKYGGEFIIDLGRAPPGQYDAGSGRILEAAELRAIDLHLQDRARLRAKPFAERETWFEYRPSLSERVMVGAAKLVGASRDARAEAYERAARELLALLPECDAWWASGRQTAYVRHFPPNDTRGSWFEIDGGGVRLVDAATRDVVARRSATATTIVQLLPFGDGVIVREDYYRHPRDSSNVYFLDDHLRELWRAERPSATDAYANAVTLVAGLLESATWEGWSCTLDPTTGRMLSREFTK